MKDIIIVTQNRAGLVSDITSILAERGINIETIDAEEVQGVAVVDLTVDRYNDALRGSRDAGFEAVAKDAFLIRVEDQPGALAKVTQRFKEAGIDLRSVRFIRRQEGTAFIALATDRTDEAKALVQDYLVSS